MYRDKKSLLRFLQCKKLAVISTMCSEGRPEAALIGIAVNDKLEIVFDTLESTRKYINLKNDPNVALVIGLDGERTVQYEGRAEIPVGSELEDAKEIYFKSYLDGRDRLNWHGITHIIVKPKWIRDSDYSKGEAIVKEFDF